MCSKAAQDDSLFALVFTLDEEDDFTDPSVWIKANPSLEVSISSEYLARELTQAQNYGGSMLTNFRTKHMNQWVSSASTWIQDDTFMKGDTRAAFTRPQRPSVLADLTWHRLAMSRH